MSAPTYGLFLVTCRGSVLHAAQPLVLGLRYISKLDVTGPMSTASSSLLYAGAQTDLHYFRLRAQR